MTESANLLFALLGFMSCGVMFIAFIVAYVALRERSLYKSAINLPRYVYHTAHVAVAEVDRFIQSTESSGVWQAITVYPSPRSDLMTNGGPIMAILFRGIVK